MVLTSGLGPIKQLLTLLATFAGVLGPTLGSFTPGNSSTAEISARFFRDVYIIPADYAFVIWAPICLGFLAFAVYQALPAQRHNPRLMKTRLWLSASALLNAAWIVTFDNFLFPLSLVIIIGMLVTALVMHRTLEIGRTRVYGLERLLRLSFSLYAGWLTAATILNAAGVLAVNSWNGFGLTYPIWGVLMLLVASAIGLLTRFRWNDPVYGAVFVWTFVGIVVARVDTPVVAITAGMLAVVFVISLLNLRRLTGFLLTASRSRLLVLGTFALQLGSFFWLRLLGSRFAGVTNGLEPFDFQNRLTAEAMYAQLPAYTQASRYLYRWFAGVDFLFPALASLFLALLLAWALRSFEARWSERLLRWHAPALLLLVTL